MGKTYSDGEDPLFLLINLDKDSKKLEKSLLEAQRIKVELVRIQALDEKSLAVKSSFGFPKQVEACWESHLSAYRFFLSTDHQFAIIFEDDFKIENVTKFRRAMGILQNLGFDLVQLGFLRIGLRNRIFQVLINLECFVFKILYHALAKKPIIGQRLASRFRIRQIARTPAGFIPNDFQPGAHAYAISRELASEIVNNYSKFLVPADGLLQMLSQAGGIKSFRLAKSLVGQYEYADSMRMSKERQ
jgi:GR25 family glycosyltransferase involved in LPS biosynthesis